MSSVPSARIWAPVSVSICAVVRAATWVVVRALMSAVSMAATCAAVSAATWAVVRARTCVVVSPATVWVASWARSSVSSARICWVLSAAICKGDRADACTDVNSAMKVVVLAARLAGVHCVTSRIAS